MNYYLDNQPGRTVFIDKKEYFFFSGYAYLGMEHVPEFTALVKEGIEKYGWLFPSSRISNTRLKLFADCEDLLSEITGAKETVIVSSGFTAGRMAINKWEEEIINLHPSHPAIKAGNANLYTDKSKVFAVDSVDVFEATVTDFAFLDETKHKKTLVIDDSHGIGIIGNEGAGISSLLPTDEKSEFIITYSLSKAFNITGGAISCPSAIANELREMPEYTAGTAPSPAMLYAFLKGHDLYAAQREKLKNNISYFQSLINSISVIRHPSELPIFILPENVDEDLLFQKEIVISSFAYPAQADKIVKRIILNALHTKDDLEYLSKCLHQVIPLRN